jgi:hypothetical protein
MNDDDKIIALRPSERSLVQALPSKRIAAEQHEIRKLSARLRKLRGTRKARSGGAR